MIIAHVLSSFEVGGQERVAFELARGQVASGHPVLAVSLAPPPDGPMAERFRACGAHVFTMSKQQPGVDVALSWRLSALFVQQGVNLVHTHNPHALIYGAPAARAARACIVHTKHGVNPDTWRRRWLRRMAASFTDAFVAVSEPTAAVAICNGECDESKLSVIPNGVDLSHFVADAGARASARAELGIADDAWVIGTVGRLAPEKAQSLILEALEPMLDTRLQLVMVGAGPEEPALREIVRGLAQREFVHLLGARSDVARWIASFDVFVLSSVTEGLPLVVPEAMAAGVPVISSAVGGIPELVVNGKTGYLFHPGDAMELRSRILQLACDPEGARRMGREARRVALERCSAQRMLGDYMAVYEECYQRERHSERKRGANDRSAEVRSPSRASQR
jgi:glycosyltransferase involved in cell wall biosynthesis